MYGHEIIEFFKDVLLEDAKTLSKTISECVHFDFGKVDDLENFVAPAIDFFELDPSGIMFDDKYLDNLPRLPFDKCMFTVHGHGKKLAFIAEDKFKNKIVSVRLIWFHKHIQGWEPSSGWFPSILGW